MAVKRSTFRYKFKKDGKVVYVGITDDLERKEYEHQMKFGEDGKIVKVGQATTWIEALGWERAQAEKGNPTRRQHIKTA